MTDNTLFLRLAGPMQSWGTTSRFQLRRTDAYPSKSGILGLLLCAKGVRREDSSKEMEPLVSLSMGVRVDRAGTPEWDYHTAGAGIGIRSADGKIKKTASTGEYETLLSRRQYLWDASFLVALRGKAETIRVCAAALADPVWPIFLGRKCCIPAEPVFTGTGASESLSDALASVPWQPRITAIDGSGRTSTRTVDTVIEHPQGSPPPEGACLVYDVPRAFGYVGYGARWVIPGKLTVRVGQAMQSPRLDSQVCRDPYGPQWDDLRHRRLEHDTYLCVFCKSPATDVHHVDYADVRVETLRSLCKLCHDACTMLEYGSGMRQHRIDPEDPAQRPAILRQVAELLAERRLGRRRALLESGRASADRFFEPVAFDRTQEGR